ncbi:hypothetical protein ACJRO7_034166 [Eucalyptus globulus]|uniref:Uncharacterized protein n=1 Tax=Eucalyptus globulus TaxID=34317 RepID=A0ABD3J5R6_EUCGL
MPWPQSRKHQDQASPAHPLVKPKASNQEENAPPTISTFFNHPIHRTPLPPPPPPPPRIRSPSPNLRLGGRATMEEEDRDRDRHSISRLVSPFELIRNCDLPPPQKLFPGIDDPAALPALVGLGDEKRRLRSYPAAGGGGGGGGGEVELLRALRLSQTRAREAEERGAAAAAERDAVARALIGEAARSSAYRRWVRVLELEVAALKSKTRRRPDGELLRRRRERCGRSAEEGDSDEEEEEEERGASMAWMVALAIPLGIAGIGLALACRYLI